MFKSYLSKEEFKYFKINLLDRTKTYCNSLIDNLKINIKASDHEYFYRFILPILIELDYLNFVSSRSFYTRNKDTNKNILIETILRNVLQKINKILSFQKIFSKYEKQNLLDKFFDKHNIHNSSIVSFSYFHRHPEYLEAFKKNNEIIDINRDEFRVLENLINQTLNTRKINFRTTNIYEEELLASINFFLNYKDSITFKGKVLLTSNHGWVGSNIARLIISYVSCKTEVPIIMLQSGFGHQAMLCVGQVIWERYISDKYATWSQSKEEKDYFLGSMYAFKSIPEVMKKKETILLPQIPSSKFPRCFSSYWSLTYGDYKIEVENMKNQIDNILTSSSSPVFRIKNIDLKEYKHILKDFKNIEIDFGDVNKSEHFKATSKTYIFYLSTSILQAVSAGSETYGIFSSKDTFLDEKYCDLIPESYPFDCNNLSNTLSYSDNITNYILRLGGLIDSLKI